MNPPFNEGTAPHSPSDRPDECPRFPEPAGPLRIAILVLIAIVGAVALGYKELD